SSISPLSFTSLYLQAVCTTQGEKSRRNVGPADRAGAGACVLRALQLLQYNSRAPEKRQRVPSAYNRFIKEEIRRIKASNPDISHREAFSTAAKNWAHFPNIHFGLGPYESSNKLDEAIGATGHPQKVQDLY
ncbi:hypothetical protein BDA96_01G160800, partial [Sorghum bicolor]